MKRSLLIFLFVSLAVLLLRPAELCAQNKLLNEAKELSYQKQYEESLSLYRRYLQKNPGDHHARMEMADVTFWKGDMEGAAAIYLECLNARPEDNKVRLKYAEVLSYSKHYDESLAEYDKILASDPKNLRALREKGDVLSWENHFDESIAIYDQYLATGFDPEVARQKARVLGWARKYSRSLKTYEDAYEESGIEPIKLEMEGKQAYWNRWPKTAIKRYRKLLDEEPKNIEARFDLGQTEGYQRMWRDAAEDFGEVLDQFPGHFRAADGLERVNILWKERSLTGTSGWFYAKSTARDTDINRFTEALNFYAPICQEFAMYAGYAFDYFHYGTGSIPRHQGRIGAEMNFSPDVWANAAYMPTFYTSDDRTSQLFDGSLSGRPFDPVVLTAFVRRDDLTNNKTVIINKVRSTNFGGRVQADVHRRLSIFGDYEYDVINDGNRQNTFSVEPLAYLSYEPYRLTLDARFHFYDYKFQVTDYWSPSNFWDQSFTVHWRHYLNPDGIYFGAKDTYYGVKYRISFDRGRNLFNGGAVEFHRDITQRLALHFEGTINYGNVYYDGGAFLSVVGRF